MMVIRLIHTKPFWSVILEVIPNPLISLMPRVKYDDENTILTFEHTTAGLLSHIPGGSDLTLYEIIHMFSMRGASLRMVVIFESLMEMLMLPKTPFTPSPGKERRFLLELILTLESIV